MTDAIEAVLVSVIGVPVLLGLYVCPIVFAWWFFHPEQRDRAEFRHRYLHCAVQVGTALSCVVVLVGGIQPLLGFLSPYYSCNIENGDSLSPRENAAFFLSFAVTGFLACVFIKFRKLQQENFDLRFKCQRGPLVASRKERLKTRDPRKLDKLERRLDDLREQCNEHGLIDQETVEMEALELLFEELNKKDEAT